MIIRYPTAQPNKADSEYQTIKYPAGELQVRFAEKMISLLTSAFIIQIDARIHNSEELVGLLLLTSAIRGVSVRAPVHLRIPYLPYARADRRFTDADCDGLYILGEMLAIGGYDSIRTLDVHHENHARSKVSPRLFNLPPTNFILQSHHKFEKAIEAKENRVAILFPDAGASKRYGAILPECLHKLSCSKMRNPQSGEILGFEVPDLQHYDGVLMVDDICDGGATFVGIAQELRRTGFDKPIGLYVTHGLFTGFGTAPHTGERAHPSVCIASLIRNVGFSKIYTTDSFWPREQMTIGPNADYVTVFDAWEGL